VYTLLQCMPIDYRRKHILSNFPRCQNANVRSAS